MSCRASRIDRGLSSATLDRRLEEGNRIRLPMTIGRILRRPVA